MLASLKFLINKKFIFFVLVLIIGYVVSANYYYPKVNAEAVQFFIKDKQRVSGKENSLYSIIGLNAPDNVQDIHVFGLKLVNETLNQCLDVSRKHLSLDTRLPKVESELTLNADVNKLYCWLGTDNSEANDRKCEIPNDSTCYTDNELSHIVKNNSILLKRHEQLKKYKKYDNIALFSTNGSLQINAHRLYLADIRLKIEQGDKDALQALIQDLEHNRILMSQPGTMIDKAIKLVLYNLSLEQLEHVIIKHTNEALTYKNEIDVALSELTIEEFNLDGIFREEFEIINSIYCIDERLGIDTPDYCQDNKDIGAISESYIINDFYKFYLSYKSMSNLDIEDMAEQCKIKSNEPEDNIYIGMLLHLPIFSTYASYKLVLGGMKKGCELMVSHKQKGIKHVELKAFLNSAKKNTGEILDVQ